MVTIYEKLAMIECHNCYEAWEKFNGLAPRADSSQKYLKLSHEARRRAIAELKEAGVPEFADEMIEICFNCNRSRPSIADKLSPEKKDGS